MGVNVTSPENGDMADGDVKIDGDMRIGVRPGVRAALFEQQQTLSAACRATSQVNTLVECLCAF